MSDITGFGKLIMMVGVGLVVIGGLLALLGKWPEEGSPFGWLGRLPGDILVKRDNFTFYFPLATSLLISVVASILLYFFFRR